MNSKRIVTGVLKEDTYGNNSVKAYLIYQICYKRVKLSMMVYSNDPSSIWPSFYGFQKDKRYIKL